ncbi:MAG: cytochrome c peroxidase [Desulforhopalus sp.]|jgi:cytochrome c peroxidase
MKRNILILVALVSFPVLAFAALSKAVIAQELTAIEELGEFIFFDENLSIFGNQSCAACHDPNVGWTGPINDINENGAVYEGSIEGRFGNRKPPSSAYATPSPILHFVIEKKEALFIGGNFWDGRATGEKLGNPAADQAQGPFLNPLEQALATPADVVNLVCTGDYSTLFEQVWGTEACDEINVSTAYDDIALSIAAYEDSPEVNAFSSKYDHTFRGHAKLTKQERRGFALFRGKGKCHRCHISNGQQALFTDFTYDNLGVPRNPKNPFYTEPEFNPDGFDWVDEGLGGFLATRLSDYAPYADANMGKQKVPTLRNVGKGSCEAEPEEGCITKAFAHNGYFKSLKGIVHFYNTRDVKPECDDPFTTEADALADDCWPIPEVEANVNMDELGDLGLSPEEEDAIVAFLMTLSDGFEP